MTKHTLLDAGQHGLARVYRGACLALLAVAVAGLPVHGGDVPDFLKRRHRRSQAGQRARGRRAKRPGPRHVDDGHLRGLAGPVQAEHA